MLYTVKEVSALSGVTIKALHHYHKIGLLPPCEISEAGYRLYGEKELERLQHILFYRELDFPLEEISRLLENGPDRLAILSGQRTLIGGRMDRLRRLIGTLDASISAAEQGAALEGAELFRGFRTEEEWKEALAEQDRHLKETYGMEPLADGPIDVAAMNEQAAEAVRFTACMAKALADGVRHDDAKVALLIREHLEALRRFGHETDAAGFAAQSRFFLSDDFHRRMLESQQTGLAYYMSAAADAYAAADR